MSTEAVVLLGTASTIGFIHTLIGPDHYLPFIVLSKARNWSTKKTRFKHRWGPELFHLTEDPGEQRNLGSDPAYARIRRQLADRLVAWMEQTKDPWAAKLPPLV